MNKIQPLTDSELKEKIGQPVWVEELKQWCILTFDIDAMYRDPVFGQYFVLGVIVATIRDFPVCTNFERNVKMNNFTLYAERIHN